MRQARLYKRLFIPAGTVLDMGKVRCLACLWKCKIGEGQSGICGVRWNKKGKLYLLVYGKAYGGVKLDPIEKKPLYHFLPGTSVLSFGTVGCNFGCLFCQNWQMSQSPKAIKGARELFQMSSRATPQNAEERGDLLRLPRLRQLADSRNDKRSKDGLSQLVNFIERTSEDWSPKEIVEEAVKVGASGIAYTYNEPAIFIEYAYDTAKLAHKKGLKNIFVSNGFESGETLELIGPYLDVANIDLKAFTEKFYQKICKAKLAPVLANIKKMYKMGVHLEITTLIIPTLNDSEKELKKIAKFIKNIDPEIPWHVSAFHPDYKLRNLPATPTEKVLKARDIGRKAGLSYVYVGNIWGEEEYSSTFCPKCGVLLIKRGLEVEIVDLDEKKEKCRKCGFKIRGVFRHIKDRPCSPARTVLEEI